ncbi:glycosyltransferase [Thiorhodovibrio frisius]|uniref:Glycosyltransferase n=1 Tax=Thiorhodovibrio frisius TaxID=631362 RepID=H8Z1T0_9GAMM|nr:glycosyltransferase [Thiorhodovibrio frisius]EIC22558.1 glycosyltransferase [Thiorhodovibrio frisius]WPL19999.1 Glycogen synthase [Thiorhodovibrio frisius]
MRVLNVYRTYFPDPPGGMQEAIRQICLSTSRLGVQNSVFTLSPNPAPGRIDRPEAQVVRQRSWAAPASCDLGGLQAVKTFRALVAEADVVHYFFPWPFADILRELAPRRPSVLTYISDVVRQKWLGRLYEPLMLRTLRGMDAVVCNSPAYARTSPVLQDPAIAERLRMIPLGIEESCYPTQSDAGLFARLAIEPSEPFVLFLGVLRYYKGLQFLLEACRNLPGKLVIAGFGPEAARVRGQARRMRLDQVKFAGHVTDSEKVALLKACRGLVLPSHLRSEAYGMVLVEASMHGKPMVSCEIGTGTSFVNQHGKTGFVVPPESPEALAGAMRRLLTDSALAARLGRNARQRYDALFSGDTLGRAYATLYSEIAKGALTPGAPAQDTPR